MILKVIHRTVYQYRCLVELHPHRLFVTPRSQHGLKILHNELTCNSSGDISSADDVFGNIVTSVSFADPTCYLEIENSIIAEQRADPWPLFDIAPFAHNFPFAYRDDEATDLGALCCPAYRDSESRLMNWSKAFVLSDQTDTLDLLKAMSASIESLITYQQRDEEGTQSPAQTLGQSSGSCRDITTLFIEAARHLGFGARAVSGYRFDDGFEADGESEKASKLGEGSTHAWAEIYLPGAGWIAFDPTHDRVGNASLIAVAVARDISQILPVVGRYVGEPDDFIEMSVKVGVTKM